MPPQPGPPNLSPPGSHGHSPGPCLHCTESSSHLLPPALRGGTRDPSPDGVARVTTPAPPRTDLVQTVSLFTACSSKGWAAIGLTWPRTLMEPGGAPTCQGNLRTRVFSPRRICPFTHNLRVPALPFGRPSRHSRLSTTKGHPSKCTSEHIWFCPQEKPLPTSSST